MESSVILKSSSLILEHGLWKEAALLFEEPLMYLVNVWRGCFADYLANQFVSVFENYHGHLNVGVVLLVNDGKYQNLLPTPVFANSLH